MTITKTIDLLRKVILDGNCERMNKSTVIGFLGELIVKEQLEKAGIIVEHCGNQTGYDLSIGEGNGIKIDVKTSRLKDEFSCGCKHWG
jgi:UDP-N-acetylglucosamine transferase subunit ALG13